MYIGDDLLSRPLDYSFDRGPAEKGKLRTWFSGTENSLRAVGNYRNWRRFMSYWS